MEKTTFICDWCGVERTEGHEGIAPHVIVQRAGWLTGLDPELRLREGSERTGAGDIFLFPKEMRQEKIETKPPHFECTLCSACVDALQETVAAMRKHRKACRAHK